MNAIKKGILITTILIMSVIIMQTASAAILDSPHINATLSYQDPDPVDPREIVELRFSIKNDGASTAKTIEFTIEPEYPLLLANGEDEVKSLGDIPVYNADEIDTGETTLKYKLIVDPNAAEGEYEVTLLYKTEGGVSRGNWITLDPFTVQVGGKAASVVIEETKTIPERVAPGESADISIIITNNGNTYIEDMTITLSLQNTTEIAPLKTSNELVIRNILGGESKEANFSIIVAPDAAVKVYKIPVTLKYTDQRNNKYEKNTYISLVVDAEPEYVLNIEESEVYKEDVAGNIVVSLSNIGVANLNYATLTLEEGAYYTILSSDTVYLGNLESDDYETAQFKIYAKDYVEDLPLQFRLVYKDAFNKNYDEQITLTTKMFTAWEAKKYGLTENGSGITTAFIILGVGVLAWYFWKHYKKSQSNPKTK